MKILAIIATAAVISFAGAAANAEPEHVSVAVSFADLNLASPQGQAVLDRRIQMAADKACRIVEMERDLSIRADVAACITAAVSNARYALASTNAQVLASR
jgi:UrcA family protein